MWATSIEERLADFVIRVFDAMGICIWTCNDTKNIRKFVREKLIYNMLCGIWHDQLGLFCNFLAF